MTMPASYLASLKGISQRKTSTFKSSSWYLSHFTYTFKHYLSFIDQELRAIYLFPICRYKDRIDLNHQGVAFFSSEEASVCPKAIFVKNTSSIKHFAKATRFRIRHSWCSRHNIRLGLTQLGLLKLSDFNDLSIYLRIS